MKTLVPFLVLILLAGCTTGPTAATRPSASGQPALATVRGDPDGATTDYIGGEIRCRIQSIDGDTVHTDATFDPGPHTVIAVLTSQGEEYVGVIQVGLPEPRAYRIHAHQRDDAITVTLVDDSNNKLVATSTAPLASQMKFNVFVKQM